MTFNPKTVLMGLRVALLGLWLLWTAPASAQVEARADHLNGSAADAVDTGSDASGAATTFPVAPPAEASDGQAKNWNFHWQSTAILQGYAPFTAAYSGTNSLPTGGEGRETVSLDLYGGLRLWSGAELHYDLLTWQGFGLAGTLGIDDFSNGEAYKIGTAPPRANVARFFIRQTIGLGGGGQSFVSDDQLTLPGKQDVSRLTFTFGRFSSKDMFDNNSYANDPRTQFMNWALMANAAWDYPSDSLGYTTGIAIELTHPAWTLRYGFFQLPNQRNGFTAESQYLMWPGDRTAGDGAFFHSWGMVAEGERRFAIHDHPGTVRLLAYLNQGPFGSYQAALSVPNADISLTAATRDTYGFGLNFEQEITKNIGVFSRLGWNNGQNEAWMFTDVNYTASLGASIKGGSWHRADDTIGLAGVFSGISLANQRYLAAGGLGILDGDGALNYSPEKVVEAYYDCKLTKHLHGTLDYQFVGDPTFNHARGSVSILGARLHMSF